MAINSDYSYRFYSTTAEAWDGMYAAIQSAQKSIYWEVFILVDDQAGGRFIQALCDRAKAGVEVKVVADAFGSFYFSRSAIDRLAAAGVKLLFFNRLFPGLNLWRWFSRLWFRNHRKVLIVDRQTVFLGGVNVKANYHKWDDVYLEIRGVVPWTLLRAFAKSYISSGGEKTDVSHLLRPNDLTPWANVKERLKFIAHSPAYSRGKVSRKILVKALEMAKETVNVLTPYYTPDKEFLKAVTMARKRGVKVNIFLPQRTDFKLMELIARAYFRLTIKAGANVFIMPRMNHGKAVTVDDKYGLVGSFNVTKRSFHLDEESGVTFDDQAMVADLNNLFNSYRKDAKQLDAAALKPGSLWSRFKEWLSHFFIDPYV